MMFLDTNAFCYAAEISAIENIDISSLREKYKDTKRMLVRYA